MLAIYNAKEPVAFKAPKPSSIAEGVPQGTKPRAQPGHKKQSSLKQAFMSSKEAKTGGSSKAPTGSKTGHSKKRKEVTSEARANPQLSSGNDASAVSTAEVNPGNSAPSDFVPQQQGIKKELKNTSYDHLFAGTDPHVLVDQTKSISDRLDTILTQPLTRKGASSIAIQHNLELKKNKAEAALLKTQPSFPNVEQLKELLDIPSKLNELTGEVQGLKN
ncbi:hypothetical protein Tco_1098807 [Tanacetum coccineum]